MHFFRCAAFIAFTLMGLMPSLAQAQTYSYASTTFAYDTPTVSAKSVTWSPGTGNTAVGPPYCTAWPGGDEDWADITFANALPTGNNFTFTFGGTAYSKLRVYSNGALKFGTDNTGGWNSYAYTATYGAPITALPYAATINPGTSGMPSSCNSSIVAAPFSTIMFPYFTDIVSGPGYVGVSTNAAVKYELLGTAPNRRFVVSFVNVILYTNTSQAFNFQVVLYESPAGGLNSNFKYNYTTGSSNGAGALVGVQVGPTDGTTYSYNQNFIDPTAGSAILWYPSNQAIASSASYRFDEAQWNGTPGEVKDASGNGLNGVRVGLATTTNATGGKICQGGQFTSNTSNTVIDAVSVPITPAKSGSIDFWYKPTVAWNATNSDAMLFDATGPGNQPFFLMKAANGGLQFVVTDSNGTKFTIKSATNYTNAAGTWHHIGVTWSLQAGNNQTLFQMFVDGSLVTSTRTTSPGGTIANGLSNLYFGDNRTSGLTPTGGTPNGANGVIDEVNTYNVQASATQINRDYTVTRPGCTAVLDHFDITHNGLVSDCSTASQITISAHDASHTPYPLTGVTLNLSTTPAHGTWSQVTGGSISLLSNIVAGAGTASYTFSTNAANPNGETSVTFGLSDTASESLTIHATLGSVTETSGAAASCAANDYTTPPTAACNVPRQFLCVTPSGFNCVETSVADSINGHLYTKVAGLPFSFDVVALKDAATVLTTYASGKDTPVTVELVSGAGSMSCAARTALSPAVTQTLTFTKANQSTNKGRLSTAAMTVNNAYPDVRCRITDANQTPSVVGCSVDDFAIRPQGVTFNTSAGAAAPSASAAPTVVAGKNFTLQAVVSPASASNYAGSLTQTASVLTAQDPTQSTQVSGGTLGTLTPTSLVTGAAAVSATYSEAGYLYLNPGAYVDTSYAAVDSSTGDCVVGSSLNTLTAGQYGCNVANQSTQSLGRFIPDHFETAIISGPPPITCPSALTCPSNPTNGSGMVYSSQPFTVQVTAKNAATPVNTTQNYTGLFAKPVILSAWDAKGSTSTQNPGAGTLTNASVAAAVFSLGSATTPVASKPYYALGTSTTAPTDVYFRAAESSGGDGVTSLQSPASNAIEAGLKVASGRIFIPNVYGSDKLPLPLPVTVQYYATGYWATSVTDSSSLSFNSALSTAGGNVSATVLTGPAGCISVNSPSTGSITSGVRIVTLAASSSVCSDSISINNAPTYLPIVPAAGGRATFGLFKSPLIYRRENY